MHEKVNYRDAIFYRAMHFGAKRGIEIVACWSTKAAISLKRVKIDEKLLWRAYRKSPTLF